MHDAAAHMNDFGANGIPFLFVIDYEMKNPIVVRLDELDRADIEPAINGVEFAASPAPTMPERVVWAPSPVTYDRYLESFEVVRRHFRLGNTYLANLTFPTPIETNLSLEQIYALSNARYKLRFADRFVVFSPESFVHIRNDTIASFPMKGTIDADLPNAEQTILADEKETAEHITIVDLIRNDIGMIADSVRVARFSYIDTIETPFKRLLQVSSEIRGRLSSDWQGRIGSILFSLLPAGSICGAPKLKTVEIIREAELDGRGYYTGVFGVFDGQALESGVMIRFVERRDDGAFFYRSGGGLTVYSDPESEYQELIDKIYVPIAGNDPCRTTGLRESRPARSENAEIETGAVRH